MSSVEEHYDNMLAPYYTWISGGAEHQLNVNRELFRDLEVCPAPGGVALDLGAGPGFQSIPLAELGFEVFAFDLSSTLLSELQSRAGDLPITAIQDNLLNFERHSPSRVEIIVCMGDTLTHLGTLREVEMLIERSRKALAVKGQLVIGFRDLSVELFGMERFIPVRNEAHRIFTCFLDFKKKHVDVHDLLYEWTAGRWTFRKSAFRKLRISAQWLTKVLIKAGFYIEKLEVQKGMTLIMARHP